MRAENYVYERKCFVQFVGCAGLLSHTPADRYNHVGVLRLIFFKRAYMPDAEYFVFKIASVGANPYAVFVFKHGEYFICRAS